MSITSVIRYVRALDSSATDGSGKTGLAFGDVTAKYLVQGGTLTSLTTETITTLGTYQAPTSAAHIRIKELSSSDPTKGVYEVHFHNTQMTDTGKKLWLFLSATGAAFQPLEVTLDALSTAQWTDTRASYLANINNANLLNVPSAPASTTNVTAGTLTTVGNVTGNLGGNVAGSVFGSVASVTAGVTLADAAITEAKFLVPAEAQGRPTGILTMIRRVWEWHTNKRTRNRTTGAVLLRNHADTGTLETQAQSTSGVTDTITEGS